VGVAGQSRAQVNHPSVQLACGERGLWVECHMEEFCVKVLKFEIGNSRKLFIYIILVRQFQETLNSSTQFRFLTGNIKINGPFKN
jgi:hypothetical protein